MDSVVVTAPTRIDLAGGTLDLWPIHHLLKEKMTVNVSIDLHATTAIERLSEGQNYVLESSDQGIKVVGDFDHLTTNESSKLPLLRLVLSALWRKEFPPIQIKTSAQSPAGAGLGGSSALAVSLVSALWKMRQNITEEADLDDYELARLCQNLEAKLIHSPTGCQDYWGAIRGGVNGISFPFDGPRVKTYRDDHAKVLNRHLIVCYSGSSRQSAINNWEIFKKIFDGDQLLLERFEEIGRLAHKCWQHIEHDEFGEALEESHREWRLRCELWPNINTDLTKKIADTAEAAGAHFSRVCGAGGGGVMAIFAAPEHHSYIKQAVEKVGGEILDAKVCFEGVKSL